MKTAIILTGQARSISQVWENQVFHLYRKLWPCDFYVSVADDLQAKDMLILKHALPEGCDWEMEVVAQPHLPEYLETTKWHMGYQRSTTQQGVLRQLWAWNRAWEFFEEKAKAIDYDLIVRVRPDTCFLRCEIPWGKVGKAHTCVVPRWSRWGGCNDRFALLGPCAAPSYFKTFTKIEALRKVKCPIHPETLLRESLVMDGIEPDDSGVFEFLTIRLPDAQHPDYWALPMDITGPDLLDAAERGKRKDSYGL